MNPLLEVCVDSVESALAADRAGADRIELCQALSEGGLTPSLGLLQEIRARTRLSIAVMIRPRAADFCYTQDEISVMRRDLAAAKTHGANMVVLGMLDPDGRIDGERTRLMVELAHPLPVTFHRAFDMARDPREALETLVEAGVQRLLTSGQEATAFQGLDLITSLVRQAAGRVIVMPGGGITEDNLATILSRSGAREFHVSAGTPRQSSMRFRNPRIVLGRTSGVREYEWKIAGEERIRAFRALAGEIPPVAG
jgi:copper homeostasis protein